MNHDTTTSGGGERDVGAIFVSGEGSVDEQIYE
jgi:hypothetical protein